MRTSATVAALIMLASVSQLSAQSGSSSSSTVPEANKPVGAGEKIPAHQQPKAADVQGAGRSGSIDKLSAEDQALDKKLRGICRGC